MADKGKRNYMKIGIIGTLLFHVVLIIVLIIYSFRTPLPLPEEKGVLVNLGYTDMGTGHDQSSQQPSSSSGQSSTGEEDVATQDLDDTPAMGGDQNHHQPDETTTSQPTPEHQPDPEQTPDESLTYQRRQRGTGSQGETQQQGSQGDPHGDPAGQMGGQGQGDRGLDFSLSGRTGLSLPKPPDTFSQQGRVVIRIWVDREGNVIRAENEMRGSTTTDADLIRLAKEAARKARFSKKNDAPEPQVGTITYFFTL